MDADRFKIIFEERDRIIREHLDMGIDIEKEMAKDEEIRRVREAIEDRMPDEEHILHVSTKLKYV